MQEAQHLSNAQYYIAVMEKVLKEGKNFVTKEWKRLIRWVLFQRAYVMPF